MEALQLIALIITISIGLTVPFILFILADLRARMNAMNLLIQSALTHTTTHSAQLAFMSEQISKLEKTKGYP